MGLVLSVAVATLLALGGSASAHHRPAHAGGPPPDAGSGQTDAGGGSGNADVITEDTDSDGVPNVPDPVGDTDNQHPSGNDRHAEAGKSGNQGKAGSDPDGVGNGGVDQPDGTGGDDRYDQDGNNGCGNDDDFEDDNNGKCGKASPLTTPSPSPMPSSSPPPSVQPSSPPTPEEDVQGQAQGSGGGDVSAAGETTPDARPSRAQPRPGGPALAFTGSDIWTLVAVAVGLVLLGVALLWLGRRRGSSAEAADPLSVWDVGSAPSRRA
jgi:hypothetical protein